MASKRREELELRAGCERHIAELGIVSTDIASLSAAIEARRGRPLRIEEKPAAITGGPCGLWLSTESEDIVFVTPSTSAMHREHILMHELGHLVCDHSAIADSDDEFIGDLLPDLQPEMVRWVLSRGNYEDRQEREAEMFATLILSSPRRQKRSSNPDALSPSAQMLERVFHLS